MKGETDMAEIDIRSAPNIRLGLIGARKARNLTQQELADICQMSRSHLGAMEMGSRNASDDTWKLLKKHLKVRYVEELWERYTYDENTGVFMGDDGNRIRDPRYPKYGQGGKEVVHDLSHFDWDEEFQKDRESCAK